jgi:hypothetical protein
MSDNLNKLETRFLFMNSLKRNEKEIYFNTYILPQFNNWIDYFVNKNKLHYNKNLKDIRQNCLLRLIMFMNKHTEYDVKNYTNYCYMIIQNTILYHQTYNKKYDSIYILCPDVLGVLYPTDKVKKEMND